MDGWMDCTCCHRTVISSHGHVVTRSTRHRSTRHRHVSSHSQLVTSEHITKPLVPYIPVYNYLHAVSLRRHPETVLNTDGVITAICVTIMISLFVQGQKVQKMYTADSRSRRQITGRQITLLRKARSTRHNAVKHDGQVVTRFYDVTS